MTIGSFCHAFHCDVRRGIFNSLFHWKMNCCFAVCLLQSENSGKEWLAQNLREQVCWHSCVLSRLLVIFAVIWTVDSTDYWNCGVILPFTISYHWCLHVTGVVFSQTSCTIKTSQLNSQTCVRLLGTYFLYHNYNIYYYWKIYVVYNVVRVARASDVHLRYLKWKKNMF